MHCKVIESGETRTIPQPPDFNGMQVSWGIVPTWAENGTKFLANAMIPGQPPSIWAVSMLGGAPGKIRDDAKAYSVSRDGYRVAFGTRPGRIFWREMWLIRPDGSQAQKLLDADANGGFAGAEWSRGWTTTRLFTNPSGGRQVREPY
jgi:hypothetical protein